MIIKWNLRNVVLFMHIENITLFSNVLFVGLQITMPFNYLHLMINIKNISSQVFLLAHFEGSHFYMG